jgi:hypothetical protein
VARRDDARGCGPKLRSYDPGIRDAEARTVERWARSLLAIAA